MPKHHSKLQGKDLPKVPTWRLERNSNPQPFGWKATKILMSHQAPKSTGNTLMKRYLFHSLDGTKFLKQSTSYDKLDFSQESPALLCIMYICIESSITLLASEWMYWCVDYVCIYARVYVCLHVCVYVCTCMHISMYVCIYVSMHIGMHECMYEWIECMYKCNY